MDENKNEQNEKVKKQAEGRIYLILAAVWIVLAIICYQHLVEMIVFAAVGVFMAVRGILKIRNNREDEEK